MLTSPLLAMILAAASVATPEAAAGAGDPIALYDAGRYEEARAALEAAEARGQVSGALLYRLHFCRRVAGDARGAADALERARAALETEISATPSLENAFYLANAYANLGRGEDARRVAAEATTRFEAGSALRPSRPMEWFQLAKLYQDQGRADEAQRHYTTALAAFPPGTFPGNVRWARRFLGESAVANSDWKTMDREYGALAEAGLAEARDLVLLARARGRLGNWGGAAEAWRQGAKLDPASADDARYAARLAETALALGAPPATAPGGEAWSRPGREQLEALMKAQAGAVQAARERAGKAVAEGAVTPAVRAEFEGAIRSARSLFVGAALEYALRGFPIRETAFKEGYAVLIFQDAAWEWSE